ncbi:MAG TPA: hypothetical protein VMI06_09260 [Terriglobia bacterium]|nr:hypothetical protein [Terriglobia bacterium]
MRKLKLQPRFSTIVAFLVAGIMTPAIAQTSRTASQSSAQSQDKVVLRVGKVQVRESAMDSLIESLSPQAKQALQQQGRKALGNQYEDMLLLSQIAESQHLDSSPDFQQHIELDREQLLANMEVRSIASKVTVSPAEVSQYYSSHPQAFQQVKLCEVAVVKKVAGSNAGFSPADAQAKADAMRKALGSGESPEQLSKQFAVPNEVYVQPRTLSATDPSIPSGLRTAFQLKVGALSPVHDMPNYLEFFQVVGRPMVSLKDATPAIQQGLRQQKVQAVVDGLKKQTPVWMDQSYFTPGPSGESNGAQH